MVSKLKIVGLIKDIFKLGNPVFGIYVAVVIVIASSYEAFFLFVIGSTVEGNGFSLPFTNFFISQEDAISFLTITFIFRALISLYSNYILYDYSIGYVGHLSKALSFNITQMPSKDYISYDSTHTIYTEANQVVNNILHPLLLIMRDSMFVAAIAFFVIYEYQLIASVFFLYLIIGSVLLVLILIPLLTALGVKRQILDQTRLKRTEDLSKLRHELFLTVKHKNFVNEQLDKTNHLFSNVVARYMFLRASNRTFLEIILFFSLIATTLTISSEVSFLTQFYAVLAVAALRALPAITGIISFANGFSFHIPALQKVGGLLNPDSLNSKKRETKGKKFTNLKSLIFFKINFSRTSSSQSLSHTFKSGTLNIIKGESGSGKSTLIKSMTGESDLFKINLFIDDMEIKQSQLQKQIAYCPQDIHIINASLMENALLFCDKEKDLIDFAKTKMNKLDFGDALMSRDNIDPSTISGGQKRRIALLRCMMLDRDILICDEPTSELDDATSEVIKDILINLSKTQMVIVTSHDERLIKASDNILEL